MSGATLHHAYITRTPAEVRTRESMIQTREGIRNARRKEQERNVEYKTRMRTAEAEAKEIVDDDEEVESEQEGNKVVGADDEDGEREDKRLEEMDDFERAWYAAGVQTAKRFSQKQRFSQKGKTDVSDLDKNKHV